MNRHAAALPVAAALVVAAYAGPARAKPQWNTGLETGVCGSSSFDRLGWCNALHADLLLLRQGARDFGVGPSLRLGTARFDDVRLDAGVSLLIPTFEAFPLVLELGPHLRNFRQVGVYGAAFFGLRSFNHYGSYEIAAGLSLIAERSFSADTPSALWITARIDGAWLALPFVFLFNAAR